MNPGTLIGDRFEIERLTGSGGMGAVYRARDRAHADAVAVKVLHTVTSPEDDRFVREVRAIAGLDHPAIVRYVSHGVTLEGERYLVTEWLEGEDLESRLARGPLSIAESVALVQRVAEALGIAHARGIVHRDIKPANLFLVGGDPTQVKLLDFGIARLRSASLVATATGTVIGTPAYMAPEQARGDKELDARADVFSLGSVLFECLTGRPAFVGGTIMAVLAKVLLEDPPPVRELRAEATAELEQLVARMLAKQPDRRPADGSDVMVALRALALGQAAPAVPVQVITGGERRLLCVVLAPGLEDGSSELLGLVRAAVEVFGATAERLADGSVLVTLSGSGAFTDQMAHAARCALAMRSLLPDSPLALASGHAVTGGRVLAGDAIDRAARLLTPKDERDGLGIRLDQASAGLLDARFDVRADGEAFALVGEREHAEAARQLLGRPSPTVGRDREMATLNALFTECVDDQVARAALVTAPAGAGKSRIRHEFLNGVRRHDKPVIIWLGRGDPMSAGSPFGMIAPAIRRAASILDGEPLAVRQAKLRARLARHLAGPELTRVTAFLGELIGVPFPDEGNVELRAARQDSRLMGDQMMRAWQDWLAAEAAHQPVVIVLEDLHWGDPPTVSFTDAALRYLRDRPLMVLALARPEVHEVFPRLWAERGAQEIRLGELTRRASERLVREVLGDAVPVETVERVVTLAAGNAFYLEELIRAVAEGRGDALPDTVLAMVEARLQSLESEARRILRAASVYGSAFWRGSVAALLGSSEGTAMLDQWLAELVERELIAPRNPARFAGETEYQFRHELVRGAAYDMLTEGDRVLGHGLAAAWLERMGESDALALAEHFERGGEPTRAVPYYLRAAEQALEGNDLPAVIARAERGIACGAAGKVLGQLHLLRAEAGAWMGQNQESRADAAAATEFLPRYSPAWYRAAQVESWMADSGGDREAFDRALQKLTNSEVEGTLTAHQAAELAETLHSLGMQGRMELMDGLAERVQSFVDQEREMDPALAAKIATCLGARAIFQRLPHVALRHQEEAMDLFRAAGDLRHESLTMVGVGFYLLLIGRLEESERRLREALELAERSGNLPTRLGALHNLGRALSLQSRHEEAIETESEALALARQASDHRIAGGTLIYLSLIHDRAGNHAAAEKVAREAVVALADLPPRLGVAKAALAQALLHQERAHEALETARDVVQIIETVGELEELNELAYLLHAEALEAVGDHVAARAAITMARDRLLAKVDKFDDSKLRESFMTRVPENARTLELAREWLGEPDDQARPS